MAHARDRLPYWTAGVRYPLLTYSHLNLPPVQPLLPIANGFWMYVDRPFVTGASKPNKQLYWSTTVTFVTGSKGKYSNICNLVTRKSVEWLVAIAVTKTLALLVMK